jgi:hypothetical protein
VLRELEQLSTEVIGWVEFSAHDVGDCQGPQNGRDGRLSKLFTERPGARIDLDHFWGGIALYRYQRGAQGGEQ